MNIEFHYYTTAFLAIKAGFSRDDAETLAYAGQLVDQHHRGLAILTPQGIVTSGPTQNFSFWDPATVEEVLAPFHFLPAGAEAVRGPSRRVDGRTSVWDVRPNSTPAKKLLIAAFETRDLYRMGLALHTFSDTWAHQNFTARNEDWNRLDPSNVLPSPGHAHAGRNPDLWLSTWKDQRLKESTVVNRDRFSECARVVYRYLCVSQRKDFHHDEDEVTAELQRLIDGGRGRDSWEDRALEFVLALGLRPYDKSLWLAQALEAPEGQGGWPLLDRWKALGEEWLNRTGLRTIQEVRAKPEFAQTPLARWIHAAEAHRTLAKSLIREAVGGLS